MPRYFLNVTNGERYEDPDGEVLSNLADARIAAVDAARELVIDGIRSGRGLGLNRQIEIVDESGSIIETLTFADAMPADDSD